MKKTLLAAAIAMAASSALAGPYFVPLTAPNTNTSVESFNSAPFNIPSNFSQKFVASRSTLAVQFANRGETYPTTFGSWDMHDFGGENNEFVFIPHEVGDGAGVTRLNRDTGRADVLLQGVAGGGFDTDPSDGWDQLTDNYGGLDPAVVTPSGTLLTGEEWAGGGRLFELLNPTTATNKHTANWRWLSNIPSVSHEGIQFDKAGNMYFVDENSSGSIYKFVPSVAGDYSHGQVFVLKVAGGFADSATGAAEWIAITDENNVAITMANPFDFTSRGGRAAADEVGGTGYCRPEDLTMGILASGNEVLSVAATCTNNVFSIELASDNAAMVREFASATVTPDTLGNHPVGSGGGTTYGLRSPDNLATDAAGNVFIIEDQNPGDIWMATDADKDGIAESVALFAALGWYGSEPTGFKVDPRDPFTWFVNVQHPGSAYGNNDSMWMIKHDVSNSCNCQTAKNHGAYVSCVSKAAKQLDIKGSIKESLMEVAASSSCGK